MANVQPERNETLVLVIDDTIMSRAVTGRRLSLNGYGVVMASSGIEALSVISREPVDLIFLDLVMEGMSGMEVLTSLKSDARYRHIPIVVISGTEDAGAVAECMAAGASAFLPKPVMASSLQETIDDILDGNSATADVPAAMSNEGLSAAESPVINQSTIERLIGDYDRETTADFIAKFEQMAPELKDTVTAAAGTFDATALPRAAHDLKGGARTLGLLRLAAVCRDIEQACYDGRLDDAANSTDALSEHYDEAMEALRDYSAAM